VNGPSHNQTERLAELISARHEVLAQLRELARRQLELVGVEDMQRLFVLLAAKHTLVERLNQLDRRLEPFRGQDPHTRQWPSPEARDRARQTAQSCELLLEEIVALEKQGIAELTQRRDEAAARLAGMHSAGRAHIAYSAAASSQGRRLDLTSDT
jgi:hypothetical protein